MSAIIRSKNIALLNAETNLKSYSKVSDLSLCIVYPNHYQMGMSSLGFQTVYSLFASSEGICCERAFLPNTEDMEEFRRSGSPLLSLESSRSLADFDVIAFSTSFEPDYLNIPIILKLARIPLYSSQRTESDPLVIAGGAAFFINPEPVADLIDVICIGEGEEVIPQIVSALFSTVDNGRMGLLKLFSSIAGVYIPAFYAPQYSNEILNRYIINNNAPFPISRLPLSLENHEPSASKILTENCEFGDMFLVEVSRGCPRGCRFCTSGFIYGTFRQQSLEKLIGTINEGLRYRKKIGLVGAAVSDYSKISELCSYIVGMGAKVSVSSLRVDRIDSIMLECLVASGHKTISLAPEGGSQRLRDMIRKNLNESQILETCKLLTSKNILNIKLYFIIGLPTETNNDLQELIELVEKIRVCVIESGRANKRLGEITVSVNPFIPKPFTPFQSYGMESISSLEQKVKTLENRFKTLSNVRLKVESLRKSYIQAVISRGDRRLTPMLVAMSEGINIKKAAKSCNIDTSWYAERTIPIGEVLPWCIIGDTEMNFKLFGETKND